MYFSNVYFSIVLRYVLKCKLLIAVILQIFSTTSITAQQKKLIEITQSQSVTLLLKIYTVQCNDKKKTNDCEILNLGEPGVSIHEFR